MIVAANGNGTRIDAAAAAAISLNVPAPDRLTTKSAAAKDSAMCE